MVGIMRDLNHEREGTSSSGHAIATGDSRTTREEVLHPKDSTSGHAVRTAPRREEGILTPRENRFVRSGAA